jgi:hypothetical protein
MPINRSAHVNRYCNRYSKVQIRYEKQHRESFIDDAKLKQMAFEQFAILGQVKETQINDLVIVSRLNLVDHFLSLGFQRSIIIESIADYIIRAIQKLNFKGYYKLVTEGLLANTKQKQICYSIYSGFKEKLYLSKVYSFFDDSLWKIVINDLLAINAKIVEEQSNLKEFKVQRQSIRGNSFLIIDSLCIDNAKFEVELEEEQEVKTLIKRRDTYITFEEFSTIKFTENMPELLYFMIYLICGEELLNYYTELTGIKSFQYSLISKGKEVEYVVSRKVIDQHESNLRRENKQIAKIIRKIKPTAKQHIINVVIRFFHAFKLDNSSIQNFAFIVSREQFISMSVSYRVSVGNVLWKSNERIWWKVV